MIKLTELKKMIKANNYNPCFYSEGLNNVIFNYASQIIIELNQCDKTKLFHHLKSINYVNDDYAFEDYRIDSELKNKLDKLKGKNYDHTQRLVDTGIQFNHQYHGCTNKTLYKIFKTEKGLMKIKDEYICMLNQDIKKGVELRTNEAHSMIYIYNNTNDCIGVCMMEKFEMSELTEYANWEA